MTTDFDACRGRRDGLGNPISAAGVYYVQDTRSQVGNCTLFWARDRKGYCCNLDEAGIYRGHEVATMRETDIAWPVEHILKHVVRHVRVEALRQHARAVIVPTRRNVTPPEPEPPPPDDLGEQPTRYELGSLTYWTECLDVLEPGEQLTRYVQGHWFGITATGQGGVASGRPMYSVRCITCAVVVHEATTGPRENVEFHLLEVARKERR